MRYDDALIEDAASERPSSQDLVLHVVSGVRDGAPLLSGLAEGVTVVALTSATEADMGKLAACRFAAHDSRLVVVLGYIALTLDVLVALLRNPAQQDGSSRGDAAPSPLRLVCGRSELRLEPDGRISLVGDDVVLRARRGMRVRGATVDLN